MNLFREKISPRREGAGGVWREGQTTTGRFDGEGKEMVVVAWRRRESKFGTEGIAGATECERYAKND